MTREVNRRQLLTVLGASTVASLAGCLESNPGDTDPDKMPETEKPSPTATTTTAYDHSTTTTNTADNSTTTSTNTTNHSDGNTAVGDPTVIQPDDDGPVQRLKVGAVPDDSPFQHSLDFLTQPTDDHPAQVRISLTNTADSEHTIQTNYYGLPFPARVGKAATGDAILVLSPYSGAERSGGCWREYPKQLPKFETRTVAPGETLSETYALVNSMNADACWPTGSYRFAQAYEVDPETDGVEYVWWFSVSV